MFEHLTLKCAKVKKFFRFPFKKNFSNTVAYLKKKENVQKQQTFISSDTFSSQVVSLQQFFVQNDDANNINNQIKRLTQWKK